MASLRGSARAVVEARLPTTPVTLDLLYRSKARALDRGPMPSAPPPLSALDPATVRRADVAVVLASGPSAAVVQDPAIGRSPLLDFFVLNHASALPVEGRLYSIEDPVLKGRQRDLTRAEAVELLAWSVRRGLALDLAAPFVIRGSWHDPATRELGSSMAEIGANTYVAPRFALPVHGSRGPATYARWARARRRFAWPRQGEAVLSPRGGLGFLLSLCIALGYPRIVLAGVDMYSDEYFFDPWTDDPELDDRRQRLQPASSSPHLTAVATGRRPSMAAMLVALDQGYLRPDGRALLVGSGRSLLATRLEGFDWSSVHV
jgi:hypothetical protein